VNSFLLAVATFVRRRVQSPSPKFHRPQAGDGENVACHVRRPNTSICRRRERRLDQLALFPGRKYADTVRIEMFDRLDRGETLNRNVMHGVKVLVGKQEEENGHNRGCDRCRLFA